MPALSEKELAQSKIQNLVHFKFNNSGRYPMEGRGFPAGLNIRH